MLGVKRLGSEWSEEYAILRNILFSSKTYSSHNFISWHPLCSGSEKAFGGVPGQPCLPDGHDWNERQNEDSDHPNQGFSFFQVYGFPIKNLQLDIMVISDVVNQGNDQHHSQGKWTDISDASMKIPLGARRQLNFHLGDTIHKALHSKDPSHQDKLQQSHKDGIVANNRAVHGKEKLVSTRSTIRQTQEEEKGTESKSQLNPVSSQRFVMIQKGKLDVQDVGKHGMHSNGQEHDGKHGSQ